MAGRTGKMTAAAFALRGPRTMLIRCLSTGKLHFRKENQQPEWDYSIVAKSYSMSYLRKVAKFNQ